MLGNGDGFIGNDDDSCGDNNIEGGDNGAILPGESSIWDVILPG